MVRKKGNDYLFVGTFKGNFSQYSSVSHKNGRSERVYADVFKIYTEIYDCHSRYSWSQDSEISVLVLKSHMKEFVGGVSLWH